MSSIIIKDVSKTFSYNDKNIRSIFGNSDKKTILNNVSLEFNKGEIIGLIGPNGSGKTTLLKLISGLLLPDSGSIDVDGKISPMLDIGIGFHPELTGRENIELFASITGVTNLKKSVMQNIYDFSGLSMESINKKFKHYSSGMKVRLGFSTISFLKPEIVLLDEITSVGDVNFQKKTMDKIKELSQQSNLMILVSHDVSFIKEICNRVIVLASGKILCDSTPDKAGFEYLKYMQEHKDDKI